MEFPDVTAVANANVYYDGKVISHTILPKEGPRKSLGIIFPGSFHFTTDAPENMYITVGTCEVTMDGSTEKKTYSPGGHFDVPGKSGFTIEVKDAFCQYVCTFLPVG